MFNDLTDLINIKLKNKKMLLFTAVKIIQLSDAKTLPFLFYLFMQQNLPNIFKDFVSIAVLFVNLKGNTSFIVL